MPWPFWTRGGAFDASSSLTTSTWPSFAALGGHAAPRTGRSSPRSPRRRARVRKWRR